MTKHSFLGPRSVIYPTVDIAASKAWYTLALGVEPYFDTEQYVGFNVNGYELGLFPGADPERGPMSYWGVVDIDAALAHLLALGAQILEDIHDVGGEIKMANVLDQDGHQFGLIQNPNFTAA